MKKMDDPAAPGMRVSPLAGPGIRLPLTVALSMTCPAELMICPLSTIGLVMTGKALARKI